MTKFILFHVMAAMTIASCSSDSANSSHCQNATECQGDPGAGCSWACIDGACKPLCTSDCQSVDDCRDQQWPFDCDGHWECNQGTCDAICDEAQCDTVDDCTGDLQCPHEGHWNCDNGQCIPVCDGLPQCHVPKDCAQVQWQELCVGYWSCVEEECQPVCDDRGCSDTYCDQESGETVESCPVDCDFSCSENKDCDHLDFPLDCPGHWECDSATCSPVCNGSECYSDIDCLGSEWDLKCVGNWDCIYGYCEGICDAEDCGDSFCDREEGEGPASCPYDCDEDDCIGEGLRDGPIYDCCQGLESLTDCFPEEICQPGSNYCVDCGNESCDPHENQYNCNNDCPQGCQEGQKVRYQCDGDNSVAWCECVADPCAPMCIEGGGGLPSGWVNSCTYVPYIQANCTECHKDCLEIGTDQEGWYSVCQSSQGGSTRINLIVKTACAPRWNCSANPERQCD